MMSFIFPFRKEDHVSQIRALQVLMEQRPIGMVCMPESMSKEASCGTE